MLRKLSYLKLLSRRKNLIYLLPLLAMLAVWYPDFWLSIIPKKKSLQLSEEQNLEHFRRNRNLGHYMANTQLLIQPSIMPCSKAEEVPVVIMVTSAPEHFRLRQAARKTWARFQLTYFVMGLGGNDLAKQLAANRAEADLYGDMIVFDFHDHYQNSTFKTALMMYWLLDHCPQAQFMLKTDDDGLVNPWTLNNVLTAMHSSTVLLGHKYVVKKVERDEFHKDYVPHWLFQMDVVPQYLDSSGYLVSGTDLAKIFKEAYNVPLVNSEGIYFTYMVASKNLGLFLHHDRSFSPKRPWLNIACAYWSRTLTHGYSPEEMVSAWAKIESLVFKNNTGCSFVNILLDRGFILY